MAHYDLYDALGLSRQSSTSELAADIDRQLAAAPADDAGAQDQLTTARAVLGDPTRRNLYDQRLDDPDAPEIDIPSIHELAALDTGESANPTVPPAPGSGTSDASGAQFQQKAQQFARQAGGRATEAGHQVQDSFRQSKLLAVVITAVVTAVVVGLAGWFLGLFGGGDEHKDAKATVSDLLGQDNADDLRSWAQDNTTYQDRDAVLSSLRVSGDGSFSGMDSLFGGSDLEPGVVLDDQQLKMTTYGDMDDYYDLFESEGYSREEGDSVVRVGIVDGSGENVGSVMMIEQDGDYKLIDVATN